MQNPDGHIRLLLCTEAYSMGADPAKVSEVIHLGPTNTVESKQDLSSATIQNIVAIQKMSQESS